MISTFRPLQGTPLAGTGGSLRDGLIYADLFYGPGGLRTASLVDGVTGTLSTNAKFTGFGVTTTGSTGISYGTQMPLTENLAQGAFTFAALVQPDSTFSVTSGLAQRNDGNTVNAGWEILCASGGTCLTFVRATTDFDAKTAAALTINKWQWVVVVYFGDLVAANTIIYYDGLAQTHSVDANGSGAQGSDASRAFIIGNANFTHQSITAGPWNGRIAACYLWKRALGATEVKNLNANPFPFFEMNTLPIRNGAVNVVSSGFPALFFDL